MKLKWNIHFRNDRLRPDKRNIERLFRTFWTIGIAKYLKIKLTNKSSKTKTTSVFCSDQLWKIEKQASEKLSKNTIQLYNVFRILRNNKNHLEHIDVHHGLHENDFQNQIDSAIILGYYRRTDECSLLRIT